MLSAFFLAASARADDASTAEAEARFKEGLVLVDKGDREGGRP